MRSTFVMAIRVLGSAWLLSPGAMAQTAAPYTAQPERPSVATHAGTVAPEWLEIEFGTQFDHYDDGSHGGSVPITGKFGLAPRIQLSISAPVVAPPGSGTIGVGDLAVGIKWRMIDRSPVLGRFALLPSLKFPSGSTASGAGTGTTDMGVLLISSHDLGPVALDLNAGYVRRSGGGITVPLSSTVWAIALGGPAVGRIGWVAEAFGFPRTSGPAGQDGTVATLFGPTLAVRDWFSLDAGLVVSIVGPQPHALDLGGVWNVGRVLPSRPPTTTTR